MSSPQSTPHVSDQQAESFVLEVQEGESLKRASAMHGATAKALWHYRERHPEFDQRLLKARREGMHNIVDRVLDVSRAMIDVDNEGKPVRPLPQVSSKLLKLGIDAALRVAGKINPTEYGDKVQHTHTHALDLASVLAAADARMRQLEAGRGRVIEGKGVVVEERSLLGLD